MPFREGEEEKRNRWRWNKRKQPAVGQDRGEDLRLRAMAARTVFAVGGEPVPAMRKSSDKPSAHARRTEISVPTSFPPASISEQYVSETPEIRPSSRALIPPSTRAARRRVPIPVAPRVPTVVELMTSTVIAPTALVNSRLAVDLKAGDCVSQTRQTLCVNRSRMWRTLGGRILWLVKYSEVAYGWSAREFGRQAGISSSYAKDIARRIDDENLDPKVSTIYALADGAKVSSGWLLDNIGWPNEKTQDVYSKGANWPWDQLVEPAAEQAKAVEEAREARRGKAAAKHTGPPKERKPRRLKESDIVPKVGELSAKPSPKKRAKSN